MGKDSKKAGCEKGFSHQRIPHQQTNPKSKIQNPKSNPA